MSDKIEYEVVPTEELRSYQSFQQNRKNDENAEPWQGGIAAEVLGLPVIGGAKILRGIPTATDAVKSGAVNLVKNVAKQLIPYTQARTQLERQIQGTIDPETGATGRARQTGYNATTMEQAAERAQNEARIKALDQAKLTSQFDPVRGGAGFTASTPSGIHTTPQSLEGMVFNQPAGAPTSPPQLNRYQQAIQKIQNLPGTETASKIVNNPLFKGAGTAGSLFEGGQNALRMYQHTLKNPNVGRGFLDAAGLLSNAATVMPTPASPWSNIAGAGLSIPIEVLQQYLENQDKAEKKATGGLVYLR